MKALKFIFGIPALLIGLLGLVGVIEIALASTVMFLLLSLTLLSIAKERYDAENKRDASLYAILAAVILADTVFNLFG